MTKSTGSARSSSSSESIRYTVVIPVYRNADTIEPLLARLGELASRLEAPMEAVFVVDGSPDISAELLSRSLPQQSYATQLLQHSRNFGSFAAIRTGLTVSRGDFVAVMAADLQEPPELVQEFFYRLERERHEVVIGVREGRADPGTTAISSRVFWWLYRRFVNNDIPPGGVDVFGCTRRVANHLLALRESHTSLVGLLFWLGFDRIHVAYERAPRPVGRSAWTFRRKFRYLLDSVYAFTDLPITLLTVSGALGVLLSLATSVGVLIAWLTGRIEVPGYTPLMLSMLLSFSGLLFGLGVVGSYV